MLQLTKSSSDLLTSAICNKEIVNNSFDCIFFTVKEIEKILENIVLKDIVDVIINYYSPYVEFHEIHKLDTVHYFRKLYFVLYDLHFCIYIRPASFDTELLALGGPKHMSVNISISIININDNKIIMLDHNEWYIITTFLITHIIVLHKKKNILI